MHNVVKGVGVGVACIAFHFAFLSLGRSVPPAERKADGNQSEVNLIEMDFSHGDDSETTRSRPGPINSIAVMPYSDTMFPKLMAKFGPTIPMIDRERGNAAQITALDTRCDEVMNVQITSSSTSNNRRYYAECRNRARFYFDADSIEAGYPAGLQTWDRILADGLENW